MFTNFDMTRAVVPALFEEIYVFGSALWSDRPNDIDILLVYDQSRLPEVVTAKTHLEPELGDEAKERVWHFTLLSRTELEETRFLSLVHHMKLR